MKHLSALYILVIMILVSAAAHADIYKYVDEEGVIHLTNIPKGSHYKKIMSERVVHRKSDYTHIIRSASIKYGIEPSLIKALIKVESNWDSSAVSKKGAIGLMQLMPETASDMKIINPYDPVQNIDAGTRYLRTMLDRFNGDLDLALAAYNSGPSTVERSGGIPAINETRTYVRKVRSIHEKSLHKPLRTESYRVLNQNGSILFTDNPSGI